MKKKVQIVFLLCVFILFSSSGAEAASKLTVNTVYSISTKVTGKTKAYSVVKVKVGKKNISKKADKKGAFSIKIAKQKVGAKIKISVYRNKKIYAQKTITVKEDKWTKALRTNKKNNKVKELIFVKYESGSKAKVYFYQKDKKKQWKKIFTCNGYVGKNGINKKKEGDKKTPTGTYTITRSFGILKDPGAKTDNYLRVKNQYYWCADKYYNKLVDIKRHPHRCKGEHLIKYKGTYDYGVVLDYNKKCVKGKGSAIFLHCYGKYKYTLGCIAIPKSNMKTIIQKIHPNAKIMIYKK